MGRMEPVKYWARIRDVNAQEARMDWRIRLSVKK